MANSKNTVPRTHSLKLVAPWFQAVWDGKKTAELRRNDRNFAVDDYMVLQEYDASIDAFSGREVMTIITHIWTFDSSGSQVPLHDVMLSFQRIEKREAVNPDSVPIAPLSAWPSEVSARAIQKMAERNVGANWSEFQRSQPAAAAKVKDECRKDLSAAMDGWTEAQAFSSAASTAPLALRRPTAVPLRPVSEEPSLPEDSNVAPFRSPRDWVRENGRMGTEQDS